MDELTDDTARAKARGWAWSLAGELKEAGFSPDQRIFLLNEAAIALIELALELEAKEGEPRHE